MSYNFSDGCTLGRPNRNATSPHTRARIAHSRSASAGRTFMVLIILAASWFAFALGCAFGVTTQKNFAEGNKWIFFIVGVWIAGLIFFSCLILW